MINLSTNLSSLLIQSSLKTSSLKLNEAIERMSTGCKLNHSKDNAANYSIATSITTKINSYQIAEDNTMMGLNFVNTASESLSLISDKLSRLRALAEQASNGTYGTDSINAIQQEAGAITSEIERIYNNTEYNGINPLSSQTTTVTRPSGFTKEVQHRDTSPMISLSSVDENAPLAVATYSISTPEELAKLATMTNSGKVAGGTEFVLANDIDMEEYLKTHEWTPIGTGVTISSRFFGIFDGNGYVISNLTRKSTGQLPEGVWEGGLFAFLHGSSVKNLGLENVNISTLSSTGALAKYTESAAISNCYVTGSVSSNYDAGGLIGETACWYGSNNVITDCWTDVTVFAGRDAGGILACAGAINLSNCASYGTVTGINSSAGLVGRGCLNGEWLHDSTITDCHVYGYSEDLTSVFLGYIEKKERPDIWSVTIDNCTYNSNYDTKGTPLVCENVNVNPGTNFVSEDLGSAFSPLSFQVGIHSEDSSVISFTSDLSLAGINNLSNIVNYGWNCCLNTVDYYLNKVTSKQTEYGAIQNRLESAIESISIQYENLVSSRSTIQDADIAEVSSEYIRQQILQQASATLMSTANQTPAIALQLL